MPTQLPQFPFRLHTAPHAFDGLTVARFSGREELSQPYAFDLVALTPEPVALADLPRVGQGATLTLAASQHEQHGPRQIHGTGDEGEEDNRAFHANLARSGVAHRVRHVRRPSSEALDRVEGDVHLLYIDGAHRYRFACEDVHRWGARVAPGGMLFIHDAFSSIGVTVTLARRLFFDTLDTVRVYLDVKSDTFGARSKSVMAYLQDKGMAASHVKVLEGINDETLNPASDNIAYLPKTDTANSEAGGMTAGEVGASASTPSGGN
jgi:hypothetical protein